MQNQASIIYDSESGSTFQAAEIIKNEISKNYVKVDMFHVGSVDNITEYDMIIVGSPNWYGKPTKKYE